MDRFVRCPYCKLPHDAAERVCPTTGRRLPAEGAQGAPRPRMSELPPPERRPEPLGFDPAKHRIGEVPPPAHHQPTTASVPITRNLAQDLLGRTIGERYLIRGVLGEGGMGMVYEAEHTGLGRSVAVKVLNPTQAKKRVAVKRFQQEARAAGAIGHPNICEVYDLGQLEDGSPYLVMEKLVGSTLSERISREGGLPFDEIVDVMLQVLAGLVAAHEKGIVHRDIKPENIFLARRVGAPPVAKILDFGVSKMMPQFQGGDEQLDLTRTGMVMGTPYYMSPEQARGERNLDGRVDVYACGVMMYESIVGKRPFLAPNYNALLLAIINTTPRPLREARPATPAAIDTIVRRMMAKARDDRYPTATAVLRDLRTLAGVLPSADPRHVRVPAPPSADERRRAPQAGGRAPSSPAQEPGATLRSRMAEAAPAPPPGGASRRRDPTPTMPERPAARAAATAARRDPEHSTRLDIKRSDVVKPSTVIEGSDSYDIPVHITAAEARAAQLPPSARAVPSSRPQAPPPAPARRAPPPGTEFVDDLPTEVFRPGMHLAMRPQPAAAPVPAAAAPPPPAARPAPTRHERTAPPLPLQPQAANFGPVDISGLSDDWDGETVVKKPAALTTQRHREKPPSGRQRQAKPFNPDETLAMKEEPSIEVDIDFDETNAVSPPPAPPAPPPRRR